MNAPPFPLNPSTGERHGSWVWNGARWVCAPTTGIQVLMQVFNASGPYMPSPGLVSAVVETWGGGGGGGAVGAGTSTAIGGGGGGGSGGYSRKALPAALVLGGVQVTIGAGGIGTPDQTTGVSGSGGPTTFGAMCIANGGAGAEANSSVQWWGDPGQGAPAGVGDIAAAGNPGLPGTSLASSVPTAQDAFGGIGGASPGLGGAGISVLIGPGANSTGFNGTSPGAGGSGACANQDITPVLLGGNGAAGLCVVTEYCWASASDGDDCMNPPINVNARVAIVNEPWPGPGPCPPGWGQLEYEGE